MLKTLVQPGPPESLRLPSACGPLCTAQFDIPAGQAAAYYPEVNPLVPLESTGDGSHTPTSKFVAIRMEAASENGLIMARIA